jgi:serine/threonine protein kinase
MPVSSPSENSSDVGKTPSGPTQPGRGELNMGFNADGAANQVIPDLPSGAVLRGRYRIHHSLGKGGFGGVYLALDIDLGRKVAIKRQLGRHLQDDELARNEAKFIANLDHPSIVKVYDLIDDEKEGVLIIMEYVSGFTLHELLRRKRIAIGRAIELAVEIAQALVHAHSRRIVHRDLKPSNVLLDQTEKVKLSDFGLALGAINLETAPSAAGTPKYMAPEQVRGESHRIDGRTDLWSLGVMLYEMLTGAHPFTGLSRGATFESILHDEPTPLRQLNPRIPEEVEHIVHRCLRKRMSERPVSAADLVDDLQACLATVEALEVELGGVATGSPTAVDAHDSRTPRASHSTSSVGPLRVEPKGLRPYSEEDGVHFLDLIPGPRERSGLPESIHFWRKWASCDNVDEYASVGVLYGPSGAGKTSFVRAGLVNQLNHDICPIVIECRTGDLARRIESAIRARFHQRTSSGSLSKLLSGLRNEEGGVFGYRKILIILDQFESWSATATTEDRRSLAEALRHCDGKTLQTLFVVRDDYWSGITEVMQWIDVPLIEHRNVRSLELLDVRHAERVLEGIGRVMGTLPKAPQPLSEDQQRFIHQAVEGLAKNERVVAVHLVMFSQIVRVLTWSPQMLRRQGGVEGACAAYLHEIFETSSGPPAYRRLSGVVADILNELLPVEGSALKASAKSVEELRARVLSSGGAAKSAEAIRVLSEDLKLITPTRGEEGTDSGVIGVEGYQLAHDFLVEPVRNWVEVARKSTWRGRAAARLVELSELWQRKPQPQFLPNFREYAAMQFVVPSSSRNEKQAKFLRAAGRYHAGKVAATTVATIAAVIFAVLAINQWSARAEADRVTLIAEANLLVHGDVATVPQQLDKLAQKPQSWSIVNAMLASAGSKEKVRAGLLGHRLGKAAFSNIASSLEQAEPELFGAILDAANTEEGKSALRDVINDPQSSLPLQSRAAILLLYAGDDQPIRTMLQFNPDPSKREAVVREAFAWRSSPKPWVQLMGVDPDLAAQYGAFAVLGTYKSDALQGLIDWTKVDAMRSHPECMIHSLAEWLLDLNQALPDRGSAKPPENANWMVNSVGMPLRRIEAGSYDHTESITTGKTKTIGFKKPKWVATTPINRTLLQKFIDETPNFPNGKPISMPANAPQFDDALELRPGRPATRLPIDTAYCLCNWLSSIDGLTPSYAYIGEVDAPSFAGTSTKELKWQKAVNSNGYSLLTEEEWMYASLVNRTSGVHWNLASDLNNRRKPLTDDNEEMFLRLARETLPNSLGLFVQDEWLSFWLESPDLTPRHVTMSRRTSAASGHYSLVRQQTLIIPFGNCILVARE